MVDKVEDAYPTEPGKYSSQALYFARQIEANKTLVDRIKEAMGKDDALRVRRLQKRIEDLEAELDRQDRDSLLLRQMDRMYWEHNRTRNVVYAIRTLLGKKPVPLPEIRRLVAEELKSPVAAPADPLPFPAESPR